MRVNNIRDRESVESIMKWFHEGIGEGENGIMIYPNLQTFRQIYTQYAKEQLEKEDDKNNIKGNKQLNPRIILIATFYETIDSVKHSLSAVGVKGIHSHIDDGSLVIVDAFSSYYPDVSGMKKLVASLSDRARREGRAGVSAIVDMGFFFLFGGDGRATELINYEASLAPKTEGGNVKGFSCYHGGNYNTLKDAQKEELAQKGKKLLEVTEDALLNVWEIANVWLAKAAKGSKVEKRADHLFLTTSDNLVKILLPTASINVTTINAASPIVMIGPELQQIPA